MDEVEELRHTELNRNIYDRRKQTIERVFADAKEKHGMRWTRYRGLEKVSMQAMLTFAALNLKKMAGWTGSRAERLKARKRKSHVSARLKRDFVFNLKGSRGCLFYMS